jgi:ABC-type Na+ transport system ATPase subunit NatA
MKRRGLMEGLAMPQIIRQITEVYDVSEAEISAHAAELMQNLAVRQLAVSA